ncbi:MAG: hypothetical protein CM1200mP34_1000 [Verrucomicrobiales bacterium]|nr:MAG: hypothetical protein CM1200mP34_1000 [Verrucomicrobiales bacterium]
MIRGCITKADDRDLPVLEGEGHLELDGEVCRQANERGLHQARLPASRVGRLKIINIPVPAFDPADEWIDE